MGLDEVSNVALGGKIYIRAKTLRSGANSNYSARD